MPSTAQGQPPAPDLLAEAVAVDLVPPPMVVVVPSVDEVATRGHRVFQGNCMSSVELPPAFSSVHASARAACTRLFFDVDDTLTWQGRLPEVAVAALYRAKAAGLMLCAVTGRSFAWGELMVRLFPFDAVVAETGANALFFADGGRLTVLHHEDDPVARAALKEQRDVAAAAALAAIPTARLATDNVGRLADTALDLVEEGEPVPEDDVVALRELLHGHGLVTARSSVHVNAFAFGERGPFDKASMVDRLLRAREGTTLDEARREAAEALAKASEAAAKPSESVAKPSELLAKPSESLAKPSELLAKPSVSTAILGGAAPGADDAVWDALEDAVAMDRLVVGDVVARREEGFLIGLGAGVHGVLPEAQLGGLDADAIVGGKLAFRVISLNAGKKRVVLSHKDVEAAAERALVGRATPIGFSDPTGGQR